MTLPAKRGTASRHPGRPDPELSPLATALPARAPPQEYRGHYLVKQITTGGTFRFQHRLLFIVRSLTHHHIGLEGTADGIWSIYFCQVLIARFTERDHIIRSSPAAP